MQEVALVARNGGERWQGRRSALAAERSSRDTGGRRKGDESRDWFAKYRNPRILSVNHNLPQI
jgi:hypothetical protein